MLAGEVAGRKLHPQVIKDIVKQVVIGLEYIHQCGIIHTDLKIDNFLLEIPNFEASVQQALEESPAEPLATILGPTGIVINYVESQPLVHLVNEFVQRSKTVKVKIADFNVSCWADKVKEYPSEIIQAKALRAPEVTLVAGWGIPVDIWSLGCLVFELFAGKPLFTYHDFSPINHLALMSLILPPFPDDLKTRGRRAKQYFNPDGSFTKDISSLAEHVPTLDALVKEAFNQNLQPTPAEFDKFKSFLHSALRLRPEDRPTAAELAKHEWLQAPFEFLRVDTSRSRSRSQRPRSRDQSQQQRSRSRSRLRALSPI